MAKPKSQDDDTSRHAKYRERTTEERNQLKELGLQAQDQSPLPGMTDSKTEKEKWFHVSVNVHRPELDMAGDDTYIMSESELLRFQHDLSIFKAKLSDARHGTYAFADSGPFQTDMPGMTTIAFYGITITKTEELPGSYRPPDQYHISLGAVKLLLSQGRHPHPLLLSTIKKRFPAEEA